MYLILLAIVAVLILLEIVLWVLVGFWRPRFQWLITRADEAPEIDDALISKHMAHGFDAELGWVRKPGTSGIDRTSDGDKSFDIDEVGCRRNPGFEGKHARVAVFGDSYAFCRLVADDETWPHFLSQQLTVNVQNFGVGNYGLDQALLRLERELPKLTATIVVMAVVPETIVRIHSYWKHYFEYGNLLAFKPRFTWDGELLVKHPSAVQGPEDYRCYQKKLTEIRNLDPFYLSKFRRDLLIFPLLPRVLLRASRHAKILWRLTTMTLLGKTELARRRAFEVVVEENAKTTERLFDDPNARELLGAIVRRLVGKCEEWNIGCVLVVVPQPVDLERRQAGPRGYRSCFDALNKYLPVIDLTDVLAPSADWHGQYVDGQLGPHLSPGGNKLVAKRLAQYLQPLLQQG